MKNIDPETWKTALLVAAASPLLQQYMLILVVAVGGSLVSLSKKDSPKGWEAIKFMFRAIMFTLGLTLPMVYLLTPHTQLPIWLLILPVSLFISVQGDKWFLLFDRVYDNIFGWVFKKGDKDA